MEFYKKLKEERLKHNLSQEDLARELNISRQSVSKWELEKGYPNIETLIELSHLFNISIDELIKGDVYLKDKIIKEGKLGEARMTQKFKWLYVVSMIVLVFWLLVLPFKNPSSLTFGIINFMVFIYFTVILNYVKNNKKKFFN